MDNKIVEEKFLKDTIKDDTFILNLDDDISYYAKFCVRMLLLNRRKYGRI